MNFLGTLLSRCDHTCTLYPRGPENQGSWINTWYCFCLRSIDINRKTYQFLKYFMNSIDRMETSSIPMQHAALCKATGRGAKRTLLPTPLTTRSTMHEAIFFSSGSPLVLRSSMAKRIVIVHCCKANVCVKLGGLCSNNK